MKLYTENHLKEAYFKGLHNGENHIQGGYFDVQDFQTPIELPSRDMADEASLTNSSESKIDFINGFIWTCSRIREHIN